MNQGLHVCQGCRGFTDGTGHVDPSGFPCNGPYRIAGPPAKVPTEHLYRKGQCIYCQRGRGALVECIGVLGPYMRRAGWRRALEKRKEKRGWLR